MLESNFKLGKPKAQPSGIVTLKIWTMMPDGDTSLYIWAPRWEIIPDGEMPVRKLHTQEKWTLAAIGREGNVVMLIPGCGVAGWAFLEVPPKNLRACYSVA